MKKPERFTQKSLFDSAIEDAVGDYNTARGTAEWNANELLEIAKSAAIAKGLSYDGFRVDDSIARAIVAMASVSKPYGMGSRAVERAWNAYREHP